MLYAPTPLLLQVVLSLFLTLGTSLVSQGINCSYFQLENKSSLQLNDEYLCKAAEPLMGEGYEVIILIADEGSMNLDDWYQYLDKWEVRHELKNGNYVRTAEGIYNTALLLQINVDEMATITYGDLYKERVSKAKLTAVKDRLKDKVVAAENKVALTQAIEWGLQELFKLQSNGNTGTTLDEEVSPANDQTSENTSGGDMAVLWTVLGILIIGIIVFIVIWRAKQKRLFEEKLKYIESIGGYALRYMNACQNALKGQSPESTDLYQLWKLYEGHNNVAKDKELLKLIDECKDALKVGYELHSSLEEQKPPANLQETNAVARNWEKLFLMVVGSTTRISLNPEEDKTLFASFDVPDNVIEDTPLIQQINTVYQDLSLTDQFDTMTMVANAGELDELGVVGRIMLIKKLILAQQTAFEEFPKIRNQVAEKLPHFESTFTPPEGQDKALWIAFVKKAYEHSIQLSEQKKIAKAYANLKALWAFLDGYTLVLDKLKKEQDNYSTFEQLKSKGYFLRSTAALVAKRQSLDEYLQNTLREGDVVSVTTHINAKSELAEEIINAANTEVEQQQANEILFDNFKGQHEQYLTLMQEAERAHQQLARYHNDDIRIVSNNLDKAQSITANLITEEDKDRLNSMQVQEFIPLKQKIEHSKAKLDQASDLLQKIISHLGYLRNIESSFKQKIDDAKDQIDRAQGYSYSRLHASSIINDAESELDNAINSYRGLTLLAAVTAIDKAIELAETAYKKGEEEEEAERLEQERLEREERERQQREGDDNDSGSFGGRSWSSGSSGYSSGGSSSSSYSSGGSSSGGNYGSGGRA